RREGAVQISSVPSSNGIILRTAPRGLIGLVVGKRISWSGRFANMTSAKIKIASAIARRVVLRKRRCGGQVSGNDVINRSRAASSLWLGQEVRHDREQRDHDDAERGPENVAGRSG